MQDPAGSSLVFRSKVTKNIEKLYACSKARLSTSAFFPIALDFSLENMYNFLCSKCSCSIELIIATTGLGVLNSAL